LTDDGRTDIVTIALAIDDPSLCERIVALLIDVAGVRLVGPHERADMTLVSAPNPVVAAGDSSDDTLADGQAISPRRALHVTPREREVLALLAEGASNKTIARRLGISVHTAKYHVGSLLDKLDATGRTDAVAHAARIGVIDL